MEKTQKRLPGEVKGDREGSVGVRLLYLQVYEGLHLPRLKTATALLITRALGLAACAVGCSKWGGNWKLQNIQEFALIR